ncbi:MAG: hypothetical protein ACI87E_000802 [Mariniblastus sp.]|jgi:hypothetical protein
MSLTRLAICTVVLFSSTVLYESIGFAQIATPLKITATDWQRSTLNQLDEQIKLSTAETRSKFARPELLARRKWLNNWMPGKMQAHSMLSPNFPVLRPEPILNTPRSLKLRKELASQDDEQAAGQAKTIKQALDEHPLDIGLLQLYFHWHDDPVRRKKHLEQVELLSVRLLKLLESKNNEAPQIRPATEHTLYRRGRALAYRELPDVAAQFPIASPETLNLQILAAYQSLIDLAGPGRPEFILLEIRVLRRAGNYGQAIDLLERYGATINPKWYQKKRRDLLQALDWKPPYSEAAKIYAKEFPQEIAKEIAREKTPNQ